MDSGRHHLDGTPFVWTKTPDEILKKANRCQNFKRDHWKVVRRRPFAAAQARHGGYRPDICFGWHA